MLITYMNDIWHKYELHYIRTVGAVEGSEDVPVCDQGEDGNVVKVMTASDKGQYYKKYWPLKKPQKTRYLRLWRIACWWWGLKKLANKKTKNKTWYYDKLPAGDEG